MTNSTGRLPEGESFSWNLRQRPTATSSHWRLRWNERVAELDLRAGHLADDGRLDDPVGDGLGERVVDDDVAEDAALLVLRGRGVVELRDHAGARIVGRARAQLVVDALDRLVPLELLVVDVVGLVVEDHHAAAVGDPLEQRLGGATRRGRG